MTRKQILALGGLLLIAFLLAFALQDVVKSLFVTPLAYLWWALGVLYSTLPQVLLWGGMVILVFILLARSILSQNNRVPSIERKPKVRQGNIELFANDLEKTRIGIYNKWKVANRLAKLARDILIQRGDRENAKFIGPLNGRDWYPSEPVGQYLEVGLNGSFADYPKPRWPFERSQPTPLDLDVNEAVVFLENQSGNTVKR